MSKLFSMQKQMVKAREIRSTIVARFNERMKRHLRVYTWTRVLNGRMVRCVVATHSRNEAAHLAGLERITASLEIGETINPVLVRAALEKMSMGMFFDGEQYRALAAA